MLKRLFLLPILIVTASSCLESDILDNKPEDHFLFSDYYLNEFVNIELDVINKRFQGANIQVNGQTRLGWKAIVTYRINADQYDRLKEIWPHSIRLGNTDITNENRTFTNSFGPEIAGKVDTIRVDLSLRQLGNEIAKTGAWSQMIYTP